MIMGLRKEWEFGDPLTPNLPASDGIYRLQDLDWPAKLPVQLLEYDLAVKLLQQLEGKLLEYVNCFGDRVVNVLV